MTDTIDVLLLNDPHRDLSQLGTDAGYRPRKMNMIMFSHDNFLDNTRLPWSCANKNALKDALGTIEFHGSVYDNLKRRELTDTLRAFAFNPDISNCECLCVVILTQGHEKPGYFRAYNRWYHEGEIFKHFDVAKNPALATKPIIFIIQASRGSSVVVGIRNGTSKTRRPSVDGDLEEKIDYHMHADAKRIVFHSSYTEGANHSGSWLTQTLCEMIEWCRSGEDLINLFTNTWQSPNWLKQSPAWSKKLSLTFTVTRHIYLKNDRDDESLSSIEEDGDMHMDDNSIHYDEPLQNLRKSENRCGFERLERPLTNAQFMKRESTTTSDPLPTRYELDKFYKNAMIIFNHEIYSQRTCTPRVGTEHDKRALKKTFQRFRFEVTTYDDLRKEDLLKKMKEFGERDFLQYGCVCVAILTHGDDHGLLQAADVDYREREVFACFNSHDNPTLAGKPVIFLIQACRGRTLAKTATVNEIQQNARMELDANSKRNNGFCLPTEADMIIFHSSFFGKASVRTLDGGTWFIQTICEQLNRHASTEHLEKIFRRVRTDIALRKEFESGKQMPVTSSTLLRELYFYTEEEIDYRMYQ